MNKKHLLELSDQELLEGLAVRANQNLELSYNDYLHEVERRRQQKNADRVSNLSILAISVSVISLVTSVLVAIFHK